MISGSLCRHVKIVGRLVIEVSSPYQSPAAATLQHNRFSRVISMTADTANTGI
jgi:hypothetical protein